MDTVDAIGREAAKNLPVFTSDPGHGGSEPVVVGVGGEDPGGRGRAPAVSPRATPGKARKGLHGSW